MALTTAQLSLIEQRVANDAPSTAVAYLLWFFLGLVSAHRFYLGRAGTAVLQILSYFVFIGFVWLLIDGFLIPGMIREKKDQIRQRMTTDLLAHAGTTDASPWSFAPSAAPPAKAAMPEPAPAPEPAPEPEPEPAPAPAPAPNVVEPGSDAEATPDTDANGETEFRT